MKWIIAILTVLGMAAGCGMQSVPEAKQDAYQRWHETRAHLLCGLAKEQYESGDLKKARSKVSEVLSLDAQNVEGRMLLAKMNIEEGDYPRAITLLDQLDREDLGRADVLYYLGVAQERRGLLEDALVSYRRCHDLDQSNLDPVVAAGEVLVAQGKTEQARVYVESFIGAASNAPGIYEMAGRLAAMQGDFATASGHYEIACDLDCGNRKYAESLGRSLFMDGRYLQATEVLKPLTQAKDYETPAWVYAMLGDCYMAVELLPQARDSYLRATELDPSNAGGWCNLAAAALAMEDTSRAMVAARQALRIDGDNLGAVVILGYAMLKDGQAVQARVLLGDASRRYPQSTELRCVLGRAHEAYGDSAAARECYSEALRIEPENRVARQLLASVPVGGAANVN